MRLACAVGALRAAFLFAYFRSTSALCITPKRVAAPFPRILQQLKKTRANVEALRACLLFALARHRGSAQTVNLSSALAAPLTHILLDPLADVARAQQLRGEAES